MSVFKKTILLFYLAVPLISSNLTFLLIKSRFFSVGLYMHVLRNFRVFLGPAEPHVLRKTVGNDSVPIQLAQCWCPVLAISNDRNIDFFK